MPIWNLRALVLYCPVILDRVLPPSPKPHWPPFPPIRGAWGCVAFPSFHLAFLPGQKPSGWNVSCHWTADLQLALGLGLGLNFCESEYPFGKTWSYKEYEKGNLYLWQHPPGTWSTFLQCLTWQEELGSKLSVAKEMSPTLSPVWKSNIKISLFPSLK